MYAIMDIGTNSCRLLVAAVLDDGSIQIKERQLRTTRIGAGMDSNNNISLVAIERTLAALEEYAVIIAKYPVEKIVLVATQAVRSASNKNVLMRVIKERLNWEMQIITGIREAWLSYLGATSFLDSQSSTPLVIDIGGGSTELLSAINKEKIMAHSVPLGALRLFENPLSTQELTQYFQEALSEFAVGQEKMSSYQLIGVGGTCTTLAAVHLALKTYDSERVQGYCLEVPQIQQVYESLLELPTEKRLKVAGIYPGREDIIIPGLQILLALLNILHSRNLIISDRDLLWGLIYEQIEHEKRIR